jgi:hypothetical protein
MEGPMPSADDAVFHRRRFMKLFLAWLVGVPVLVLAMVVARAMSPAGFSGERHHSLVQNQCLPQLEFDSVRPVVAGQRDRVTCHRRAVQ